MDHRSGVTLARRTEQALERVADDDETWARVQSQISTTGELGRPHRARPAGPGRHQRLRTGRQRRSPEPSGAPRPTDCPAGCRDRPAPRALDGARAHAARKPPPGRDRCRGAAALQAAERQVDAINKELGKRPTSTGVKFRLCGSRCPRRRRRAGGFGGRAQRLLNTSTDLWSLEDRRWSARCCTSARRRTPEGRRAGGSEPEQLAQALDYRRWHRFRVQRWQDGQWRPLSGPASSGERALGLTVPLFAAVSSFYSQASYAFAPRLVLLDEAFAGIDDAARAHCMGLIREFDLDFVITSEREWACYAELPGVAICQLQRREGIDAVHVSRWTWDGRGRQREDDPDRRFPPQ
jgi:hypothetical protein